MVSKILKEIYLKKDAILKNSSSKKIVSEYEKNIFSDDIYKKFKYKSYMRTLYQLVIKSFVDDEDDVLKTVQEISEYIENNIKMSLKKPIYMIQMCDYCKHSLNVYDTYIRRKSKAKKRCPICRNINDLNDVVEEEDWSFPDGETYDLLEEMSDNNIICKEVHGVCNKCNIYDEIDETILKINDYTSKNQLIKYLSDLYCNQCKELYDIYKLYRLNNSKEIIFWKDGYWLEWYVKKYAKIVFHYQLLNKG